MRTLTSAEGIARFVSEWNSTAAGRGTYALETTLRSMDGIVLDREVCAFSVKGQESVITSLDIAPPGFQRGQNVLLSVTVTNPASEEIAGVLVISVQNSVGKVVKEFRHNVSGLAPGMVQSWTSLWTTAELVSRDCRVLAYLLENGETSGTFLRDWTEAPLLWDSIRSDAGGLVLTWPSGTGRLYTVEWTPDLLRNAFSDLVVNLPATSPQNVHTDMVLWPPGFYRLREQW